MPRILALAERNDVPFTDQSGTLNPGGSFLVQGLARAGRSSTGVGSWFQGTYGAILLNADGSYTYRLDHLDPDTNVLGAGQVADDRFTYTYTLNGVAHTDTITVRVTGLDEPGQVATSSGTTLVYPTPAIIDPLTQIVSTAEFGVRLNGFGDYHQSINRGSIRVGGPSGGSSWGLELGGVHWLYYSAFQNDGRIEAVAGLSGANAYALSDSSAAPLVNNGVLRAVTTGEDTFFSARAVGIMGGPHDATIVNNGTIEAISADGGAFGMWTGGIRLTIRNSGFIYVSGGHPQDQLEIVGIRNGQSTGLLIENSGTIHVVSTQGAHTNGITIFRDSTNVHSYGTVINSGTIVADTAIRGYAGYHTGLHVTNSGHIEGDLDFDLAQNIITNAAGASWLGMLRLGLNEDAVRNAGFVQGDILLGDEDDLFDGRGGIVDGLVDGGRGFDVLFGGAGADRLSGGEGLDRLNGGGGADSLSGGAGADLFVYDAIGDSTAGAFDTIADFETGLDRIDLSALAPTSIALTPSGGYTMVTANTAAGQLVVRVAGAIAQSDFILTARTSVVTGTAQADSLFATVSGSELHGGAGDDTLDGSDGNDFVNGGEGADLMRGGRGNDVYVVDSGDDRHIELDGEGVDEVWTFIPYSLQAFVENITLLGTETIDVAGNRSDNVITGSAGHSFLYGREGNDVLIGGGGGDIMDGGPGADIFLYAVAGDSVSATSDRLALFETGIDRIDLRAVNPTSVTWQETMSNYWMAFAISNVVTVQTAAGAMTIRVDGKLFLSDFLLGGELVGTDAADTINGTVSGDVILGKEGNDGLYGLGGADTLSGQAGDDLLDGGGGADRMTGGAGDDLYFVDDAQDVAWETFDQGYDTLSASVSYTLAPQVFIEILQTGDQNGTAAINLTGNTQNNIIKGNAGDNILDGGVNVEDPNTYIPAGVDTLIGYGGNDTYLVDGGGDVVVEAVGGGFDTVVARASFVLNADAEIEVIAVSDQPTIYAGPVNLTGNAFGQAIRGDAGANILDGAGGADFLSGGAGNDRLIGGAGNDRLEGGAGADTFVFAALGDSSFNARRSDGAKSMSDIITDFVSGQDKIDLSEIDAVAGTAGNDAFTFLGTGAFTGHAGELRYQVTGGYAYIFADLDGNGLADMEILANSTILVAADFVL